MVSVKVIHIPPSPGVSPYKIPLGKGGSVLSIWYECFNSARLTPDFVVIAERGKTMKNYIFICAAALVSVFVVAGCAGNNLPGPRLREIEQAGNLSDDDIKTAREACHLISTTDYNCADLVPPEHGMSTAEWNALHQKTKICRRNQLASFNHCLRGKGVRYSEFH